MASLYIVAKNGDKFYNSNIEIKNGKKFELYIFTCKIPSFVEIKIETKKEIFTKVIKLTETCTEVPILFRTIIPGISSSILTVQFVDEYSDQCYKIKNDEDINLLEFIDPNDKAMKRTLIYEKYWYLNMIQSFRDWFSISKKNN